MDEFLSRLVNLRWWATADLRWFPALVVCAVLGRHGETLYYNGEYCTRCGDLLD